MDAPSTSPTTPQEFVTLWKNRGLTERASSQSHFIQLCRLLGVSAPFEAHDEADYCFDAITAAAGSHAYTRSRAGKRVARPADPHTPALFGSPSASPAPRPATPPAPPSAAAKPADLFTPDSRATRIVSAPKGSYGFADVWRRGCFCWEYKRQGKHADLDAALDQLKHYRDSLDNPPLLIVCDVDHYEIHTNFTGYPSTVFRFTADELVTPSIEFINEHKASPLHILKRIFDADAIEGTFRPSRSLNAITEAFAKRIADLAKQITQTPGGPKTIEGDPVSRHEVAHFLMQIVFCLFAEDVGLLPADRVTSLIRKGNSEPRGSEVFSRKVRALFKAMEKGGDFGEDTIDWFNGGLFKDVDKQKIPTLSGGQLGIFVTGQDQDWSAIEPSILGTLFERALDEGKRAQIGAHYTSRDDIMLIVGPVIMDPLRKEWAAVQQRINALITKRDTAKGAPSHNAAQAEIAKELKTFHDRLATVSILDPACGSGNFLYVAIQCLLDLEKEVLDFAGLPEVKVSLKARVNPTQLHGIEINEYAAELARISIWIGFLKWKKERAAYEKTRPILHPLNTIEQRDAILDRSKPKAVTRAKWPKVDFIVGNPPFLGSKLFRKWGMQDDYLKELHAAYDLPKTVDLCCYWFEEARKAIERNPSTRVGLLATQGIRGGDNRTVLERIKKSGDIFMAWADREWVLDGAAVHVAIVGFDQGTQPDRTLDGQRASTIHANLSNDASSVQAKRLEENRNLGFIGGFKKGKLDLSFDRAMEMLSKTGNPHRRPNSDVIRRWVNGEDIVQRESGAWIIDFGVTVDESLASQYEHPFEHARRFVKPERAKVRTKFERDRWWMLARPVPEIRRALSPLNRCIVTPRNSKHRIFRFFATDIFADGQLVVFARQDDYLFGALQAVTHEIWARALGTQLREAESGFRYTPSSTFETFPLPWAPEKEPIRSTGKHHAHWREIASAGKELDGLRENWLNPPDLIAKAEQLVDIKYRSELAAVPADVRPLVRRSAVMAEAASNKTIGLTTRTLTNLYNERPAWLRLAHLRLDRAVLAAYKAVDPKGDWDPAWADAYEPFGAGEITIKERGKGADKPETIEAKKLAIAARGITDAKILANLLRLNHERSAATKTSTKAEPRKSARPGKRTRPSGGRRAASS